MKRLDWQNANEQKLIINTSFIHKIMAQVQVLFSTTVNPNGFATTLQFFVGTDISNLLPVGDVIDCGTDAGYVPKFLQIPLEESTGYFVKGVVTNQIASTESVVASFTTPPVSSGGAPGITDVVVSFP